MPKKILFWSIILLAVIITALILGLIVGRKTTKQTSNPPQEESQFITITDPFTIIPGNRVFEGMNLYSVVLLSINLTDQKASEISPGVTEHVWSYKIKEKDYRFKTLAVSCEYKKTQGSYTRLGSGLDSLTIGENYRLGFVGLEEPLDEAILTMWDKVKEDLPGCREVWEDFGSDSKNPDKLRQFFIEGSTSGLEVDEQGIVDFRKVMTLVEARKKE